MLRTVNLCNQMIRAESKGVRELRREFKNLERKFRNVKVKMGKSKAPYIGVEGGEKR